MMPRQLLTVLASLLKKNKLLEAEQLLASINPLDFNLKAKKQLLKLLQNNRVYPLLEKIAALFLAINSQDIFVLNQYNRALIEQGRLKPAISLLNNIDHTQLIQDVRQHSEILGLLGRAYKESFIKNQDAYSLKKALEFYTQGWLLKGGDNRWHGINVVALHHLADKHDSTLADLGLAKKIAQKIMTQIKKLTKKKAKSWDYGTAFEAEFSLGNTNKAAKWLHQYITSDKVNAFMLNGTLRQATEIWNLDKSTAGSQLLQPLVTAVLDKTGGSVSHENLFFDEKPSQQVFEKIWGKEGAIKFQWFNTLIQCTSVTCQITDEIGNAQGTGFIFEGEKLNSEWAGQMLLATNAHVVSQLPEDEAPLTPDEARAEFTLLKNRPIISLGKQVWHSSKLKGHFDISIYQIDTTKLGEEIKPLKPFPRLPDPQTADEKNCRMIVIGHPNGRPIEVSLFDNLLDEITPPYIFYHSPTEGGSSGSPVFNIELKLIAIHHAANHEKQLNEGVSFKEIKKEIAAHLQKAST